MTGESNSKAFCDFKAEICSCLVTDFSRNKRREGCTQTPLVDLHNHSIRNNIKRPRRRSRGWCVCLTNEGTQVQSWPPHGPHNTIGYTPEDPQTPPSPKRMLVSKYHHPMKKTRITGEMIDSRLGQEEN